MTFQEKLMALRKQHGWSQEYLGIQIGVSRQTVSKWELGSTTPELDKLILLSDLFELSLDELVGRENIPSGSSKTKEDSPVAQSDLYTAFPIRNYYEYKSKRTLFGLPLVHINLSYGRFSGLRRAKGIIAIGNIATGILAFGGISAGIFSLGGISCGLFSLGGLSLAVLLSLGGLSIGGIAFGGLALGIFACGSCAIGVYSIGGAAIAAQIASGGTAYGAVAIGNHPSGIHPIYTDTLPSYESICSAIRTVLPHTPDFLIRLFASVRS